MGPRGPAEKLIIEDVPSSVVGGARRPRRTLPRLASDGVQVRGNLYFVAAHLPRSHRILIRRRTVKGFRDLADDLAHVSQVAGSLCVFHARFWCNIL